MSEAIIKNDSFQRTSCTIIVNNEEDRILRCLESVRPVVDEIIVVDSDSTDRTMAICKEFGAICYNNTWVGYGQQKRFAETKANHDWILNLDADEWLPQDLQKELLEVLGKPIPSEIAGFEFVIKQVYPGKNKPRPFADYHRYIRLYNKEKCRFPESAVFDEIKLEKKNFSVLSNPVYHQSIRSLRHLMDKNIKYYRMQKSEVSKFKITTIARLISEPFSVFLKYYVFKRHITGGFYGLTVALTIAYLRTRRLMILIEKRK